MIRRLEALLRWLSLAAVVGALAVVILYAPVRAQRSSDLTATDRELVLALARVTTNEAMGSEPDGELVAQVVLARGDTARARLRWLRAHSRCVMGELPEAEALRRPGLCRWTRHLRADGEEPIGWDVVRDGAWARARVRWRDTLIRSLEYVTGARDAAICDETPRTWDGVRYGRARVSRGGRRRILDCREPYTADPAQRGLHNYAVTWGPLAGEGSGGL